MDEREREKKKRKSPDAEERDCVSPYHVLRKVFAFYSKPDAFNEISKKID